MNTIDHFEEYWVRDPEAPKVEIEPGRFDHYRCVKGDGSIRAKAIEAYWKFRQPKEIS